MHPRGKKQFYGAVSTAVTAFEHVSTTMDNLALREAVTMTSFTVCSDLSMLPGLL